MLFQFAWNKLQYVVEGSVNTDIQIQNMGLNIYRKQARSQAISNNNSQAKHNSDQKRRKTVSTIMFAKVRPEFSVYLAINFYFFFYN